MSLGQRGLGICPRSAIKDHMTWDLGLNLSEPQCSHL